MLSGRSRLSTTPLFSATIYATRSILLRNELYRRLPTQPNQKDAAMLYQVPTNVLGIGFIADHLELLAKSLPDSE